MGRPLPDAFWEAAARAAQEALRHVGHVLVPDEMLPLDPRFAPIEFSWGLPQGSALAFCVPKDDVDRLAPWLRDAAGTQTTRHPWANEVFVLGTSFDWPDAPDPAVTPHLSAWFERVQRHRAGTPNRPRRWRLAPGDDRQGLGPHLLIVGASAMGNVGDDLLAQGLAAAAYQAGASRVYLSGPDVDPLHLRGVDAVVVGGGGLVYASRDGADERQNLANYLKFGPMATAAGKPVAMLGISDQDHADGLSRYALATDFARQCLPHFQAITTRDPTSAAVLQGLGASAVVTGADLVFARMQAFRAAPTPMRVGGPRIALTGELLSYPVVKALLAQPDQLRAAVNGADFELLVMSEDDLPHVQSLRTQLRAAGAAASMVDLRQRPLATLAYLFGGWHGLITTRFHGLVLAAMAGLPVLALDAPDGKKARLLHELGAAPDRHLLTIDRPDGLTRLCSALRGDLTALDPGQVARHAELATRHFDALSTLLSSPPRQPVPFTENSEDMKTGNIAPSSTMDRRIPDIVKPTSDGPSVGLCWAASTPETEGFGNLGDSLSAVMVSALAGLPVHHVAFDDPITKMVAVGSIGHAIRTGEAVVWGCGVSVRGTALVDNVPQTRYDVRAVRGPISADHFRRLGVHVPEVYGDPVWLLPSIFNEPIEKKYELGVIPHIQDVAGYGPSAPPRPDSMRYMVDEADASSVTLINTWHEPTWEGLLATLRRILECKRILSQSFHGVVIAETYGIPVLNFRHMPGAKTGPLRIDLNAECKTDPRIWEFFKGGPRQHFDMYAQRRDERSDWNRIIQTIDTVWQPFEYNAQALVDAFPLPLAYDPLTASVPHTRHLEKLRF